MEGEGRVRSDRLPRRVAERMGRLAHWATGLDITRQEYLVVMYLVTDGGKHLETIASHATIGKHQGCSVKPIAKAIDGLEAKGLLTRQIRRRADGGRTSDRLRLVAPVELTTIRDNEEERAAHGHEGDIDYGDRPPSENDGGGYAETTDYPSPTYREVEGEKGSAAVSTRPPRSKRRGGRMPASAAEVFGEIGRAA